MKWIKVRVWRVRLFRAPATDPHRAVCVPPSRGVCTHTQIYRSRPIARCVYPYTDLPITTHRAVCVPIHRSTDHDPSPVSRPSTRDARSPASGAASTPEPLGRYRLGKSRSMGRARDATHKVSVRDSKGDSNVTQPSDRGCGDGAREATVRRSRATGDRARQRGAPSHHIATVTPRACEGSARASIDGAVDARDARTRAGARWTRGRGRWRR